MAEKKENIERVEFVGVRQLKGMAGIVDTTYPQLPQKSMTAQIQEAAIREKVRDHNNRFQDILLHFALGPRGYRLYQIVYKKNGRDKVKNEHRKELESLGYKIVKGKLKSTMTDEEWIVKNISMNTFQGVPGFTSRQGAEVS